MEIGFNGLLDFIETINKIIANTTGTTFINMGIYFIGKKLIAYSIVQTVKAFRKFNKTS